MNHLSDNSLNMSGNDSCVQFIKLILQELRLIRIKMKEVRKLAIDMKSSLMMSSDSKQVTNINKSEEVSGARVNSEENGFIMVGNDDKFVPSLDDNEDKTPTILQEGVQMQMDTPTQGATEIESVSVASGGAEDHKNRSQDLKKTSPD